MNLPTQQMLHATLPDGGPVYRETNLSHTIVEPMNALTAIPFLFIAVYWMRKLRTHRGDSACLKYCITLLAIGGVGGTLFHAFRASRFFYLMDILPIALIGLTLGGYLWAVATRRSWAPVPVLFLALLVQRGGLDAFPRQIGITLSYLVMAGMIVVPLFILLRRRAFADTRLVVGALVCFAAGISCRAIDAYPVDVMPIGTHWLWHLFSAASVTMLTAFVVRARLTPVAVAAEGEEEEIRKAS